jgi:hypothetical protein
MMSEMLVWSENEMDRRLSMLFVERSQARI